MLKRRIFAGERLKALRAERGLNQAAMGKLLEVSTSYLSQLENDDRPLTPALVERLSRAFPLDWREIGAGDAEARLAARLARGETMEEAAEALAISRETARSQAKAVYAKTGVNRQAGLVALVLSLS